MFELFGFDLTLGLTGEDLVNYARIVGASAGLGTVVGVVGARYSMSRNLKKGEFKGRVAVERVAIYQDDAGMMRVDFKTEEEHDLITVLGNKRLVDLVKKRTKAGWGIMASPPGKKNHRNNPDNQMTDEQRHHGIMMVKFEALISGNQHSANVAVVMGRKVQRDTVAFAAAYLPEDVSGDDTNDNALIRVLYVDPQWIEQLRNEEFVANLTATRTRHEPWIKHLATLARLAKPKDEGHGGTNTVWYTTMETLE
jgi:hypothetical protein